MMIALRADHDIDDRRPAIISAPSACVTQPATVRIHGAAVARGLVLDAAQPPEFGVDLLGGLFTDVAGVENHQVRVIHA